MDPGLSDSCEMWPPLLTPVGWIGYSIAAVELAPLLCLGCGSVLFGLAFILVRQRARVCSSARTEHDLQTSVLAWMAALGLTVGVLPASPLQSGLVVVFASLGTVAAAGLVWRTVQRLHTADELDGSPAGSTADHGPPPFPLDSQRDEVSRRLSESLAHLGVALAAGRMGAWEWDLEADLVSFSIRDQAARETAGELSRDEFLSRVHPADRDELKAAIEDAIATGISRDQHFRLLIARDGIAEYRWQRGRGVVLRDARGRARRVIGVSFDATAERQTHELVQVQTRAVECATNSVLITDARLPDNPIIYVNPAFERLTGYSHAEVMGRNCRFLQGVETAPDQIAAIRSAIHDQTACDTVLLNYRKNGTAFWNQLHVSPVFDGTGKVTHFVGIQHDMTREKLAERQLEQARMAAQDANRAKSDFLASMSHEIRTPLTAILGCADTLYRQSPDSGTREMVGMIRNQGELLLGILNDILDLSRIEAGKLEVRPEACSVVRVVHDVLSLMNPLAVEKGVELDVKYATRLPAMIRTDSLRLRQILLNLTGNAVKFTEQGRVTLHVDCEQVSGGAHLVIRVADTGPGIPPDQLNRIFAAFEQVDAFSHVSRNGSGLGLAICRRLVELLGGEIQVESRLGFGSTFAVVLPIGLDADLEYRDEGELTAEAFQELTGEASELRMPCRVLVAEDTRGVRFMLERMLDEVVDRLEVVTNGEEAVSAVEKAESAGDPFDLVIMDMQMPVLSGYDATSRLRLQGYTRPIIALTAGAMAGDRERCLKAGCTAYVSKPIERGQLLSVMHDLLQNDCRSAARPAQRVASGD